MGKIFSVEQVIRNVKNGTIKNPRYQRGLAWDAVKISKLAISLIRYAIPPIMVNKWVETDEEGLEKIVYQIIDGNNRVRALLRITSDEFKFKFRPDDIEEAPPKVKKLMQLLNGKKFGELPPTIQEQILNASITLQEVELTDLDDIQYMFVLINEKPTPLNTAEFAYSIFYNPITELVRNLSDKPDFIKLSNSKYSYKLTNEYKRFAPFWLFVRFIVFYKHLEDISKGEPINQLRKYLFKQYGRYSKYGDTNELVQKILEVLSIGGIIGTLAENYGRAGVTPSKKHLKGMVYYDVISTIIRLIIERVGNDLKEVVWDYITTNELYIKDARLLVANLVKYISVDEGLTPTVSNFLNNNPQTQKLVSVDTFLKTISTPEFQRLKNADKNIFKSPFINERFAFLKDFLSQF